MQRDITEWKLKWNVERSFCGLKLKIAENRQVFDNIATHSWPGFTVVSLSLLRKEKLKRKIDKVENKMQMEKVPNR